MSLKNIQIDFKEVEPIPLPKEVATETRLFEIKTSSNIWCYDNSEWLDKKVKDKFGSDWRYKDGFPGHDEVELIEIERVH